MKHRHKMHHRAKGGRVVYEGKGSNVEHEAEEHKHGGGVHHKHVGKVHGHKGKHRQDKRARGGGIGANTSPFSTAARHSDIKRTTHNAGHKEAANFEHGGKATHHMHPGHHGGSHPGHGHHGHKRGA